MSHLGCCVDPAAAPAAHGDDADVPSDCSGACSLQVPGCVGEQVP